MPLRQCRTCWGYPRLAVQRSRPRPPRLPAPQHLPTTCVKSRHLCVSVCVRERHRGSQHSLFAPPPSPNLSPTLGAVQRAQRFLWETGTGARKCRGIPPRCGGAWPQAPSAPAHMPGHVAPFKAGPRAASCTSHFPREKRAPGHRTVLPGAPRPLAPTPQGPRGLTVKEKKGATVGASHGPSCRGVSRRWGRAVSVAELGSCASFPKARLAFIKGGGGEQPRAQGPPRNWRGSWKPTGKWSENTDPGAPRTHTTVQPAL